MSLVLGGTRSGKSEYAESLVKALPGPVTYMATAVVGDDPDFARRVEVHRRRRPEGWTTAEVGAELVEALGRTEGSALVDSLGTWVAGSWSSADGFAADSDGLCRVLRERRGHTVLVSEEVGLGVHPPTEAGRQFADALGHLNRAVAGVADDAVLVVAGRVLRLDRA